MRDFGKDITDIIKQRKPWQHKSKVIDKTIRARWGSVRKGDTEKVHDAIGLATHYYEMRPKPHAPPKGKIPPQFVPFIRQQQEAKRKREENAEPVPIADMT
jgi:hypothetical protein